MTAKRTATRKRLRIIKRRPVFLPEEAFEELLGMLGQDSRDPGTEMIRDEINAICTAFSTVAPLSRVTLGQAKAEMRRVLEAAGALDDALDARSMATMFSDTEVFRIELGDFITACEEELRLLPAKTRQRPHRYDLRSAVPAFNQIFKRHYWRCPGRRRAQDRDRFIRAALARAGVSRIPRSGRHLRRYLKSDV